MRKLFLLLCLTFFMHSTIYATQGEVDNILCYSPMSRMVGVILLDQYLTFQIIRIMMYQPSFHDCYDLIAIVNSLQLNQHHSVQCLLRLRTIAFLGLTSGKNQFDSAFPSIQFCQSRNIIITERKKDGKDLLYMTFSYY